MEINKIQEIVSEETKGFRLALIDLYANCKNVSHYYEGGKLIEVIYPEYINQAQKAYSNLVLSLTDSYIKQSIAEKCWTRKIND